MRPVHMNTTTSALVLIAIAALLILLGVPLIMRAIPRNPVYGVRFPQCFKSDKNWYQINAYGGKWMVIWSLPILILGIFGLWRPGVLKDILGTGTLLLVVCTLIMTIQCYFHATKVDRENGNAMDAEPPTNREAQPGPAAAHATGQPGDAVKRCPSGTINATGLLVVACALIAGAIFAAAIVHAGSALPERVASHFDAAGRADGWMRRPDLIAELVRFCAIFALPVPVIAIVLRLLLRRSPSDQAAPGHPPISREALDFLVIQSFWCPTIVCLFCAAQVWLTVAANRRMPPTLDLGLVGASLGAFFLVSVAVVVCTAVFFPRMKKG